MTHRIFFKLLAAFLAVIAVATGILDVTLRRAWENSIRQEITQNLTQKTQLFAKRVENSNPATFESVAAEEAAAAGARATVIDRRGLVLADSEANPDAMENHATRPEFIAALAGHVGSSTRRSKTVGIEFLYVAVPVAGGAVRLAYPLSSIEQGLADIRRHILQASALAILFATLLAAALAGSLARRLQRILRFAEKISTGDFSARVADRSLDEIGILAAVLDRTGQKLEATFRALKDSRAELETLLNSIEDGVIAVSAERKVQWVNGAMRKLLPQAPRIDARLVETMRDPDLLALVEEAVQENKACTGRAEGVVQGKAFQATASPMPEGGVVLMLHDITEIERVEKTRRDFIANVSHELRTPLTSIQGYAETLLDSATASTEFLDVIKRNAARMAKLTEDLLTLARVESGEQRLKIRPIAARELLEDAVSNVRDTAQSKGVQLSLAEVPDTPVLADPDAIHQVFANLTDNALKYAASGSKIQMGAAQHDGKVEFFVRDFGPGIPSEHLPRLFERFYRVDAARSRDAGGTGLGLAIVKHIVRQHGGQVRVESELNHGSNFLFTLPAAQN